MQGVKFTVAYFELLKHNFLQELRENFKTLSHNNNILELPKAVQCWKSPHTVL